MKFGSTVTSIWRVTARYMWSILAKSLSEINRSVIISNNDPGGTNRLAAVTSGPGCSIVAIAVST